MSQISDKKTEEYLSKLNLNCNISQTHKHSLRRALLCSSYFNPPHTSLKAWFSPNTFLQKMFIPTMTITTLIITGYVFINSTNTNPKNIAQKTLPEQIQTPAREQDLSKIFQELYAQKKPSPPLHDLYKSQPYQAKLTGINGINLPFKYIPSKKQ